MTSTSEHRIDIARVDEWTTDRLEEFLTELAARLQVMFEMSEVDAWRVVDEAVKLAGPPVVRGPRP